MQNLKNDSHYLAINTQNGKATIYPPTTMVNELKNHVVDVDNALEVETKILMSNGETSQKLICVKTS